ncbi:MAG TPA: hypothetical protein VFN22_01140 [Gemmatimonadales bacterium]|nr:hypothetical protein [Gemmatimonadales bacterium]
MRLMPPRASAVMALYLATDGDVANDSTFLDVFADTTLLGRLMVDGRRTGTAGTVRGHWLALACGTGDLERPYRLQRYRIVEP